ncbi:type IV pilin N-terminal domain-containing protein [Natrinema thermotolerans]|uniref:Type IV pilin N-terminal domain-containing protein n=1 Tax=Natrinema thermotolerans TaxID=121872 RepID=A0AAF0T019_9EURY|nr:type IV pilin N-terminal domain-containing protein [Natrinema thermotolerans]QCC59434.1 type IV pilin [Natrinema thermotolerans]WMT06405.1 type IV pilin N-terminal domain-containing protein [Natrinema thermotolerans]
MDLEKYQAKLVGSKEERAVSPVIGVILMVAITVILAAVIAAFVLDLGQGQSATPAAGITFDQSGEDITITVNNIQRNDADFQIRGDTLGCDSDITSDTISNSVGASLEKTNCDSSGTINIIGTYEGEEAVVAEYEHSP